MPRSMLRVSVLILIGALVLALPIGLVTARSTQPQAGELLTNPGFEEPFVPAGAEGTVAQGWQAWYVTPDGATYPIECPQNVNPECKAHRKPNYRPSQPQDPRVTSRFISGNSQQWGTSFAVFIGGVYQPVSGITPGTRLQFSAHTLAFNCSDDRGCFGGYGQTGRSYEAGNNYVRVGIDPTGGENPFSANIVWSPYANPLDVFVLQTVEAVAQSDKVTVFVWAAPEFPEKHVSLYVDSASLVATGTGPAPTATVAATVRPTRTAGTPGTPGPTATIPPDATTYTVVAGDTLSLIAQRYGLTLNQLLALNPQITDPALIEVGQVINVSGQAPTVAAKAAPTATPQPTPTLAPSATPTVAATETAAADSPTATPLAIAATSGLCVQAFDDLNGNLLREADEPLVSGVVFDVKRLDGTTAVNYTTTGAQEPYCFSTLPDGRYAVNTQLPAERNATTDAAWQMSLLAGTNVSIMLGTQVNAPPTAEPTAAPTAAPVTAAASTTTTGSGNGSTPMALLGGGALILLAGVALFFGLRARNKAV